MTLTLQSEYLIKIESDPNGRDVYERTLFFVYENIDRTDKYLRNVFARGDIFINLQGWEK